MRRGWKLVLFVTMIGLALRVVCCFCVVPFQLHPDEQTIVDKVMDIYFIFKITCFYRCEFFNI